VYIPSTHARQHLSQRQFMTLSTRCEDNFLLVGVFSLALVGHDVHCTHTNAATCMLNASLHCVRLLNSQPSRYQRADLVIKRPGIGLPGLIWTHAPSLSAKKMPKRRQPVRIISSRPLCMLLEEVRDCVRLVYCVSPS
jgi:hypothetical protein